jgi:hypothetical protein
VHTLPRLWHPEAALPLRPLLEAELTNPGGVPLTHSATLATAGAAPAFLQPPAGTALPLKATIFPPEAAGDTPLPVCAPSGEWEGEWAENRDVGGQHMEGRGWGEQGKEGMGMVLAMCLLEHSLGSLLLPLDIPSGKSYAARIYAAARH